MHILKFNNYNSVKLLRCRPRILRQDTRRKILLSTSILRKLAATSHILSHQDIDPASTTRFVTKHDRSFIDTLDLGINRDDTEKTAEKTGNTAAAHAVHHQPSLPGADSKRSDIRLHAGSKPHGDNRSRRPDYGAASRFTFQ